MKKLAIVDNSLWPDIYNPVEHWSRYLELPFESFRATEGNFPDLDDGFTHLILTGSEASIIDPDPWVKPEIELVREAVERDLVVLGSCYGHQLLALALAGPDYVRRAKRPEIGWIEVEIIKSDPLVGDKKKIFVFASHYDEVCDLDDERFEILARSEHCQIQAFRLKGKKVWGIQAHPEIDPANAHKLLQGILQKNFSHQDLIIRALNSTPVDSGWIEVLKANFLSL